jgi:hypothetical protein
LKPLLSDTRFNKTDRARLTEYNKHRLSGGEIMVSYRLGRGCEEHQLGRLFPQDGIGMQSFRFDMRNPIAARYYWDIDVDNAHYRFAVRFTNLYKIQNTYIMEYIQNRETWLRKVSNSRKKSKTEFLKILYGGNIKLYREEWNEVDGEVTQEGGAFLKALQEEVKALMDKIWIEHSHLHKIKVGAESKPMNKRDNCKASLMSLLFQTEERKVLMYLDHLLKQRGRYMSVLIHDGGYVEKISGETQFPVEILDECAAEIESYFGIPMKLTQKPIEYDWEPLTASTDEYTLRKKEFEKNHCMVGPNFIKVLSDGTIQYLKEKELKTMQRNNHYMEADEEGKAKRKFFFDQWLQDKERLSYEKVDFYPDAEKCPSSVFNLFKGFAAEKHRPKEPMPEEEVLRLIKPFLVHIGLLTSEKIVPDNYDELSFEEKRSHLTACKNLLLQTFANTVQTPMRKPGIVILLRDESGLLTMAGGTGKTSWFDVWGESVIGQDYYYVVHDNKEMYGSFTSQYEAKLTIVVDEASSKENHANQDIIKATVTAKNRNVNRKNVAQYTVQDFARQYFNTNHFNAMNVNHSNRRIAVYDCDKSMRDNVDYFTKLQESFENPNVIWAFFYFLKYMMIALPNEIEFQRAIPRNAAYREMVYANAPAHLKWIISKVKEGTLQDKSTSELYDEFAQWVHETREGKEDRMISQTMFSNLLFNSKEANEDCEDEKKNDYKIAGDAGDKSKSHGIMLMKWNTEGLVASLKKLSLLREDFVYSAKGKCLVNVQP